MQIKCQFHRILLPSLKWMGLISVIGLTMACDGHSKNKTAVDMQQSVTTEKKVEDVEQVNALNYKLEPLQFDQVCSEQECPDIKIQRLHSNFVELDTAVDRYIYNYMSSFLQGFDLADNHSVGEIGSTIPDEANSPVQDVQKLKDQQNKLPSNANNVANDQQTKLLLEQQVTPFVEKFFGLAKEVKSLGSPAQLSVFIKPQVLSTTGPISTVVINANNYVGGAHGSSAQQYINFELSSKRVLSLDNIIQVNKRQQLNELVYQKFQAWVQDTQPDTDFTEYENLWGFKLSNNFYLAPQGLVFQYGEYEIGPYVAGLPRLVVPYNELATILKQEYLPSSVNTNATVAKAS